MERSQNNPLFQQWDNNNNNKQNIIEGNDAQYKIRRNKFLGRGGFGIVFGAIKKQKNPNAIGHNYQEVVLKEYKKSEKWQSEDDWDRELIFFKNYLKNIKSDFLLKIHDIFQEKTTKRYFLAIQYASGGSLFDRIKSSFKQSQILQFVKKSAQILKFLHYDALQKFKPKLRSEQKGDRLSLIHRDFKPGNLVFKDKNMNSMCLIDFGIAKVGFVNTNMSFNNSGTNNYKAPQIYQVKTYNSKVDIYSFGCTLYQLFTCGQRLIGTVGVQKKFKDRQVFVKNKLVDLQLRFSRSDNDKKIKYPNFWLQILNFCLMHDPKDRWNSNQLLNFISQNPPERFRIGADYFGQLSEETKLGKERKQIYQINFEIYRLNLIQQRIFAIFEHLYFNQPRLSKFTLYGILKYVIIFELEKFIKIKEKCKIFTREDKLLLVKRLFQDKKLQQIKRKSIQKMKSELQKEIESNKGTASKENGHIEDMIQRYPELLSQTNPEPRRTLYQFCYQERITILEDEKFAVMVVLILILMDEVDWYPQLRVDQKQFERNQVELLSIKKLNKFRPSVQKRIVQQGVRQILEGCRIELSLKSKMNRDEGRTDILLQPL